MNNDDITKDLVNLFKQCLSNPVFMRNFQLLLETPLEQREKNIKSEIMDAAHSMYSYSLKDDAPPTPKILNQSESLKLLMDKPKSFCRFGDGEFRLINGESIPFQTATIELSNKLKDILSDKTSGERRIYIGLPYNLYHYDKNMPPQTREWFLTQSHIYRKLIADYSNLDREYIDAALTLIYVNSTVVENKFFENYYNKWKKLFSQCELFVIIGEGIYKLIKKHNIFNFAKSVEYCIAPSLNAYEVYSELMKIACKQPKDRVICSVLGPTATVLSFELSKLGYMAWDLGHLPKEYVAFMEQMPRTRQNTDAFWTPDV